MNQETPDSQPNPAPEGTHRLDIVIDRNRYRVKKEAMTGQELRALVNPDIPMTRDLFQMVPGGDDVKIELDTLVPLRWDMRFFTAPAHINPGCEVN